MKSEVDSCASHAFRNPFREVVSIVAYRLLPLICFLAVFPTAGMSAHLGASGPLMKRFGYCHGYGETRPKHHVEYYTYVFEVDIQSEHEKWRWNKDFLADLKETVRYWADGPSGSCVLFESEDAAEKDRQRYIKGVESRNEGLRENGLGSIVTELFDDYVWQPQTADQ